jgi:hypothetical protein
MSFIDLYSNNVFTDAEITRRTELMIRTHFTEEEELILNRKLSAKMSGVYTPTPEEEADFVRFGIVAMQAQQEGIAAKKDNELLKEILRVEPSYLRLREPIVTDDYEDQAAREEAQTVVDSASGEVMEWIEKRNPVVEENP